MGLHIAVPVNIHSFSVSKSQIFRGGRGGGGAEAREFSLLQIVQKDATTETVSYLMG